MENRQVMDCKVYGPVKAGFKNGNFDNIEAYHYHFSKKNI